MRLPQMGGRNGPPAIMPARAGGRWSDARVHMLTQTAQYALRAMCFLALRPRVMVPTGALAEHAGAPATYLAKVLGRLAQASLVEARRGVGGGYKLARPAGEIRLADVIRALDDPSRQPRGLPATGRGDGTLRPMNALLDEIGGAMIARLENVTLADFAASCVPLDRPVVNTGSIGMIAADGVRLAT